MKAMGQFSLAFVFEMLYVMALSLFLQVDKVQSLDCGVISNTNTSNVSENTGLTSSFVSNCVNGDCVNGVCVCKRGWYGPNCERCSSGYYGNALNGGQCKPCECNGQANTCHTETGGCFCTTKGVTGEDCGRCDTQSNYDRDPKNGLCFYNLITDYQFTFNLSKESDRHYTRINFRNSPTKPDIDADFQITCSIHAKMNISYTQGVSSPQPLFENMNCSTFRYRFAKNCYSFSEQEYTTIYVYVYDFQPPLWIQISFSQSPKSDFSPISIAFLKIFPMLLLAILLPLCVWKLIQHFSMRSRRQQSHVEVREPSESHL